VYYLQQYQTLCADGCPAGQYGGNNRCYSCPSECTGCSSSSVCSGCQAVSGQAFYLSGSSCLADCGEGSFGKVSGYLCQPCATGCKACTGPTASECSSCKMDPLSSTQYYLVYSSSICSQSCPSGQYSNNTSNRCLMCSLSCLTCSGSASNCLTCGLSVGGLDLFLSGSQCLAVCAQGYYGEVADHTCKVCTAGCAACTGVGLTVCSQCTNVSSTVFYKQIGTTICGTTCPAGQFIDASIPNFCQKCSSTCITCATTA
jgi:proprotein convertase subtilisin/kexin type 5